MAAKPKPFAPDRRVVITANRLRDGKIVWLGTGANWVETIAQAHIFAGASAEAGLAQAAADEARQYVVGAYAADVAESAGGPVPHGMKERIRAGGPSIPVPAGA